MPDLSLDVQSRTPHVEACLRRFGIMQGVSVDGGGALVYKTIRVVV